MTTLSPIPVTPIPFQPLYLSITPATLARLNLTRQLQIARFITSHYKASGEMPSENDANVDREWLGVRFGEGGPERMIRVSLLAKWSKTFGDDSEMLSITLCPNGLLVLKRKTSKLSTYTVQIEYTTKGKPYVGYSEYHPLAFPENPPILLRIDSCGLLSVDLPGDDNSEDELKTLRAEVASTRKALALGKQYVKAQKVEKEALGRLTRATEEADAAKALLASMTVQQATQQARRILAARRLWKATKADLTETPPWILPTYTEPARTGWSEEKQDTYEVPAQQVETMSALSPLITIYRDAITARLAYKPRLSWPRWVESDARDASMSVAAYKRTHPEKASTVYGPQFDRLKETEDKTRRQVEYFLRERFAEYCAVQGLPAGDDIAGEWISDTLRPYSRARLLMKEWEASRRAELESLYDEAKAKRERLEGETEMQAKENEE